MRKRGRVYLAGNAVQLLVAQCSFTCLKEVIFIELIGGDFKRRSDIYGRKATDDVSAELADDKAWALLGVVAVICNRFAAVLVKVSVTASIAH